MIRTAAMVTNMGTNCDLVPSSPHFESSGINCDRVGASLWIIAPPGRFAMLVSFLPTPPNPAPPPGAAIKAFRVIPGRNGSPGAWLSVRWVLACQHPTASGGFRQIGVVTGEGENQACYFEFCFAAASA